MILVSLICGVDASKGVVLNLSPWILGSLLDFQFLLAVERKDIDWLNDAYSKLKRFLFFL